MSKTPNMAEALYNTFRIPHRDTKDDLNIALAAYFIASELSGEQPGTCCLDDDDSTELMLRLGERIMDTCYSTADSRFTFVDMADAIVHYPMEYSMKALVELPDDEFETVILYMAQFKRNTYERDNDADNEKEALRILGTLKLPDENTEI